jgi:uncharacterized protein
MTRYYSYRSYLKKRFGKPVLKIPLNAGFSCPNRDGTISNQGCSFCDNRSFSPVAVVSESLAGQLESAIRRDAGKHKAFIAYLQPFSNTYGGRQLLETAYEPLVAHDGVVGLAVGTRPDCFTRETFDYLEDVSRRTYLSVEIGLQSGSSAALSMNNRGHDIASFVNAVRELSGRSVETVAHVMIGLPPDTKNDAIATARFLASLPVNGIKIHQLMIVRGTAMEIWYRNEKVNVLSLEEYVDILCDFLAQVRPDQHIHRIMADSSVENGLVAPMWSADKMRSINYIHRIMDEKNLVQGAEYR